MVSSPYVLIVEDEPGIQILLPRLIARLSPSAAVASMGLHILPTRGADALPSVRSHVLPVLY
jgi:hypothetical protein